MRAACGRADLVRALAADSPEMLPAVARLLGFAITPAAPRREEPGVAVGEEPTPEPTPAPLDPPPETPEVWYWQPVGYQALDTEPAPTDAPPQPPPPPGAGDDIKRARPDAPAPSWPPLASWPCLLPRLRGIFAEPFEARALDLDAVVSRISQGQWLERMPHQKRLRWGRCIQVIDDRSQRLTPFWRDQDLVYARLARLFPRHAIERARSWDGCSHPTLIGGGETGRDYGLPPSGTLVVVLGDLGCLDAAARGLTDHWRDFGRRLRTAGCRAVALMPCPPSRWPSHLQRHWRLLAWERPAVAAPSDAVALAARAERLLGLVSPAVRIEPGLLRGVRRSLGPAEADAGTEADVWQHPAVISPSSVAATLEPTEAKRLRETFGQEGEQLQRRVLALLRQWRANLPPEIWLEEIYSLAAASQCLLPEPGDLEQAAAFIDQISRQLPALDDPAAVAGTIGWLRRLERRVPESIWSGPRVGSAMQRLWWAAHRDDPSQTPPSGFDPHNILAGHDTPVRHLHLRQHDDQFVASFAGASPDTNAGSLLATMRTANGLVTITEAMEEDRAAFWKTGHPPPWAEDWGRDGFGAWATFSVTGGEGEKVTQRLRWVPPGRFLMGSPESEAERDDDEGPQHSVTISRGFWLMDTACTQRLWQAVMGTNPSAFPISPDHPVEQVSWNDVQDFLTRFNARIPGLGLTLPTEAQWEYACRAGTITPFSFGATITPEQVNYFDGRAEKTVPVASLPANPWGLYEMHGNVWEWCLDDARTYETKSETDPHGPLDTGGDRVIRGGSWSNGALHARAACRRRVPPDFRFVDLGFRCVPVQAVSPAGEGGAEPADPARVREAERRTAQGRPSGAVLWLDRDGLSSPPEAGAFGAQGLIPKTRSFRIFTDRERLSFGRITRPDWATAIGRDRFGLWTSFAVPAPDGAEPVTQRLRWVPPGRFLMGSPESEAERDADEGPQHSVTISRGFWFMDTACTQRLWQAVMNANPSAFPISPDHPVEQVSWNDVQDFLAQINERIRGLNLTLPTEAQWEYACRAGTTTPFSFGATITPEQVNYRSRAEKTVPVASLPANPWGLYEMHGNVWEWCLDGMRTYEAKSETDPHGPLDTGAVRVLRGGSWNSGAQNARAACRRRILPDYRYGNLGFRCVPVQS